jgi:hypothetical protein
MVLLPLLLLLPSLLLPAACSVATACDKAGAGKAGKPTGPGAAKVSANNPDVCKVLNQVATVCMLDTGMSRMAGEVLV